VGRRADLGQPSFGAGQREAVVAVGGAARRELPAAAIAR
jgi:hypothetical protein